MAERSRSGADRGKPQGIRSGATGLMTSIVGWRQAFESAVMAGSDRMGRTGNVRTVNRNRRSLEHVLAGAAFGALALGSPAMAADMPLKAPHLRPAFDWSGFYIGGHTGYGRGSSSATLTDPQPFTTTSSVFSGVIGGVQAGYNFADAVRPAARRRSRSDLSELPALQLIVVAKFTTARSEVDERWTISAPCAAALAMPAGPGWPTPPAVSLWPASGFSIRPPASMSKRSISTSARAGRPAPDWNTPSRRTGA